MSIHIFQFRNFLSFAEKRPPPEKLHKGFFGQNDEGRDTVKKRLMLWGYLLVLGWLLLFGRRPGAPGQGSFVPFLAGVPLLAERGLSAGNHPAAGVSGECAVIPSLGNPPGPGKILAGETLSDVPDGGTAQHFSGNPAMDHRPWRGGCGRRALQYPWGVSWVAAGAEKIPDLKTGPENFYAFGGLGSSLRFSNLDFFPLKARM